MSDPVTNVEIEDVLSSIRRLVSEDTRAAHPDHAQPVKPVSAPEALVLTQEHRVTDKVDAPVVSETARDIVKSSTRLELERAIAELEAAVGLEDETESAADLSAPEERSQLSAVDDLAPEEVAPGVDDLDWEAPIGRAVDGEPPLSNSEVTAEAEPVEGSVEDVAAETAEVDDLPSDDVWDVATDEETEIVEAEPVLVNNDDQEADTTALETDQQEHEAQIADASFVAADDATANEAADPASTADVDQTDDTAAEIAETGTTSDLDEVDDTDAAIDAAFEDASFEDVGEFEDPEGEQAPEEVISTHAAMDVEEPQSAEPVADAIVTPFLRQRRGPVEVDETDYVAYAAEPDDEAPEIADDPFDDSDEYLEDDAADPFGDQVIDEAMLRDMVADIVRQELQGELGERITRNVRKLVRREINRALAGQDFI